MNPFRITVVYDNHPPENKALKSSWGFACVIEGFEKTILFDTGTSGPILMNNFTALGFNPAQIDAVVISHGDWDHLGGLWTFLDANSNVEVYLPDSFSTHLKDEVNAHGARVISVGEEKQTLCPGVISSGEMNGIRNEQALLLQTDSLCAIVTGCAHPGIVPIVERLYPKESKSPLLVMGGFHLKNSTEKEIQHIVEELLTLNVQWVAPTHCSGEQAEAIFANRFKTRILSLCPGAVVEQMVLCNK